MEGEIDKNVITVTVISVTVMHVTEMTLSLRKWHQTTLVELKFCNTFVEMYPLKVHFLKDGLAVSEQGTNAELLFISRVAYNKQEPQEGL